MKIGTVRTAKSKSRKTGKTVWNVEKYAGTLDVLGAILGGAGPSWEGCKTFDTEEEAKAYAASLKKKGGK